MAGFSIASFNVLNLHLPGRPIYGKLEDAYSPNAYDRKVGWIGQQLTALKAEIVGFQEVWSLEALQEAAKRSNRYTPEQVHISQPGPSDGPSVALATSLEMVGTPTIIPDFPDAINFGPLSQVTKFERPLLHARVKLRDETTAHVMVVHLKSKRPKFADGEDPADPKVMAVATARSLLQRAAEAAALRCQVIEFAEDNKDPVIVIGDLNDSVDAVTTQIVLGERPFGGTAASRRRAYDVNLTSTYTLYSERSTRDVFYTHIFDRSFETLDHILVSDELAGPGALATLTELQAWNDHLNTPERTRSDHGQVVARFRWNS